MLGLFIGAAILGTIIAVMEDGEFPGWGRMILCVLAALLPATIINLNLPPHLFIIDYLVGAICAAFAISGLCGMSVKRTAIAAEIYFAIQTAIAAAFYFLRASV